MDNVFPLDAPIGTYRKTSADKVLSDSRVPGTVIGGSWVVPLGTAAAVIVEDSSNINNAHPSLHPRGYKEFYSGCFIHT